MLAGQVHGAPPCEPVTAGKNSATLATVPKVGRENWSVHTAKTRPEVGTRVTPTQTTAIRPSTAGASAEFSTSKYGSATRHVAFVLSTGQRVYSSRKRSAGRHESSLMNVPFTARPRPRIQTSSVVTAARSASFRLSGADTLARLGFTPAALILRTASVRFPARTAT
jgi:hypothetical protein